MYRYDHDDKIRYFMLLCNLFLYIKTYETQVDFRKKHLSRATQTLKLGESWFCMLKGLAEEATVVDGCQVQTV
jgi:hypothetical protein